MHWLTVAFRIWQRERHNLDNLGRNSGHSKKAMRLQNLPWKKGEMLQKFPWATITHLKPARGSLGSTLGKYRAV